jgi:hypothetical protein
MRKFLFSLFLFTFAFLFLTTDANAFFRRRVVQTNVAVNVGGFGGVGVGVRNRAFVGGFRNRAFVGGGAFINRGAFFTPFATNNQVIFGSPFVTTPFVTPFIAPSPFIVGGY